jgi:hypothetical protein
MNIDKQKLRVLMDRIAAEKGEFAFFGLFLRDEARISGISLCRRPGSKKAR